jgi:hypothetical protein
MKDLPRNALVEANNDFSASGDDDDDRIVMEV